MAANVMQVNGIELPVEAIGDPAAPAVLLVAGTAISMDFWREDLCAALVAGSVRVVRHDQRDTGMAPADALGSPAYGLPDLLDDAISPDPDVAVAASGRALVARRDVAPGEELTLDYFDQPLPERYLHGPEARRLRASDEPGAGQPGGR